jgi:hypothetical protein
MAIDFPNSPSTNSTYTVGAKTWMYDGEKWLLNYDSDQKPLSINAQTATYTAVLGDAGKIVEMNITTNPNIFYIPTNASVPFPVGTTIDILQTGSGKTQIAAVTSGTTTINSANGVYLRTLWSAATVVKRATDTWVLFGDTSTS